MDHLVGEERDGHDASHLALVLAIDNKDHVLAFACEDIKDPVASTRAKLYTLCVEHLLGQLHR